MHVELPTLSPRIMEPYHRFVLLIDAAMEGAMSDDPIEDSILRFLRGDDSVPAEVKRAVQLYVDTRWRNIVEALFLAGATCTDIYNLLEIDMTTVAVFADYLFDMSVFKDYPDRWNYVKAHRAPHGQVDEDGYEFKIVALDLGIDFLRAKIRPDIGVVSSVQALSRALTIAYIRVCEDGSSKSVRRAEEARKWSEVMVKALQVGAELDADKGPDITELIFELKANLTHPQAVPEGMLVH